MPYCCNSQAVRRDPCKRGRGLVHQDMDALALFMSRSDDAQGRTPIHHCQRAGITVMDDGIAIVDQCGAMRAHPFIDLHILIGNPLGFFQCQSPQLLRVINYQPLLDYS